MKISSILWLILFVILVLFSGCNVSKSETSTQLFKEAPPTQPITVAVSFPGGAPPLNQTRGLRVTVKTRHIPAKAMNIRVNMPNSFELIEGSLSWTGDVAVNSEIPVVKAMIKSTKSGSWTLDVTYYLDPEQHSGYGGTGHHPVYLLISENSAEWRLNSPYGSSGISPLPPGQAPATSYTPSS